jgi:serine/threonine protein phosphatase 1
MSERVLAIGDIHGCFCALTTLLEAVAPSKNDTVVFVGDAVDRGPASREVIDCILALREQCKVVFIMGNHEEIMRDAISGRGLMEPWLTFGGRATLDSYGGKIENVPPEHLRFLVSAAPYFETESEIFVHANLESGVSLANQRSDFLRWKHIDGSEPPYSTSKRVICGHTSQRDGAPLVFNGWVCIDTYAYGGQWLSCLDVESNQVVQANEKGELREFPLSNYA